MDFFSLIFHFLYSKIVCDELILIVDPENVYNIVCLTFNDPDQNIVLPHYDKSTHHSIFD